MSNQSSPRSALIAAAVILVALFLLLLIMPAVVQWLGQYNQWLAYSVGALSILIFFGVFWLRARYQRKRDGE